MDLAALTTAPALVYLVIALFVAIDSVIPAIPAETAVISAGTLAGAGHLHPVPLVIAAILGAVAGDHLAYSIGGGALRRPLDRAMRGRRGQRVCAWATRRMARGGVGALIAARFVPGGRTATTTLAGWLRFPQLPFLIAVSIGGLAWATYSVGIGYTAGSVLPGPLWQRVAIGIGVGLAASAWFGTIRRIIAVRRRLSQQPSSAVAPDPSLASPPAARPHDPASASRDPQTAESLR